MGGLCQVPFTRKILLTTGVYVLEEEESEDITYDDE